MAGSEKSAQDFIPQNGALKSLRAASKTCRGCHLYKNATQTVFGEGSPKAKLLFVGEQPGDQEDLEGKPFVGPAGKILRKALAEAGILEEDIYVTNAVKHFKWEQRGKRRLHKKPNMGEIRACRPWLENEIARIKPKVIVLLGATAAQSVFGSSFKLTSQRGHIVPSPFGSMAIATFHPSAILRHPKPAEREAAYAQLVNDLRKALKKAKA